MDGIAHCDFAGEEGAVRVCVETLDGVRCSLVSFVSLVGVKVQLETGSYRLVIISKSCRKCVCELPSTSIYSI